MKPLATMPLEEARRVEVLLFDLDDTLLTHGTLTRAAYDALWSMHESGIALMGVTGRPSGWGEVLARQWPVLAIVTENGAVALRREGAGIVRSMRGDEASRAKDRARLQAVVDEARARFDDAELADDNEARRTDVTFDVGERRKLAPERIAALRAFLVERGARTTVSSVHLHATFEGDDKASGALRVLRELRGVDAGAARARACFVGDSENDAACFAAFPTTVGVANVSRWVSRLSKPPRYVTPSPMGAGFAELAQHLVSARLGNP